MIRAAAGRKRRQDGVEWETSTVGCGAQFAMLKSIKLHGGKTVLNTIKAKNIGERQIYK